MKNKDYQKLKDIICETNSDIRELKFGCEIVVSHPEFRNLIKDTINSNIKHTMEMARMEKMQDYFGDTYFITNGFATNKKERLLGRKNSENIFIIESILGRPIRLADVLLALGKNEGINIFCDGKGQLVKIRGSNVRGWKMTDIWATAIVPWNLKDNNLDNQSDPTKKFLIDLLVNNK